MCSNGRNSSLLFLCPIIPVRHAISLHELRFTIGALHENRLPWTDTGTDIEFIKECRGGIYKTQHPH